MSSRSTVSHIDMGLLLMFVCFSNAGHLVESKPILFWGWIALGTFFWCRGVSREISR